MSRTVLAVVVAVVIAALTAVAFFVTSTQFDDRARSQAKDNFRRGYALLPKLSELEAIDVQNKAERLAADKDFLAALATDSTAERQRKAGLAFSHFQTNDREGDTKPDIIALVDANGLLVAMSEGGVESPSFVAKQWKKDGNNPQSKSVIPALDLVLGPKKVIISDTWNYKDQGIMKIGVAPVIDFSAGSRDPDSVNIVGAVLVGYVQTARKAQLDSDALGAEIAYFDGTQIVASSLDPSAQKALADAVGKTPALVDPTKKEASRVTLGGVDYNVASIALPRKATKVLTELDKDYPKVTAGAMVLAPTTDTSTGLAKIMILLVGIGALAIGLLGMYLTHRRIVTQVDSIEMGVIDIINGNVDRTFRPVGDELDGLANGLNVMLSRLLGRPEPGEEEFDDEGNPIVPGRVEFEEGEDKPAADPDLAALAQESEPDYYKRVFTEYLAQRKAVGNPDEVSFENFIAKLKVNEGKLKAQYQCRAVRFRVVTKDGKVTLKPVPIFA